MRFAYADPPYPGLSWRYYRKHRDYGGEVDHAALVRRLESEFPDGWALSTNARSLPAVLAACPAEVRVAAWFRGERPAISYGPLQAWEPVLFRGGRAVRRDVDERRIDALVHVSRPRLTDPKRVVGAKPATFIWWMFSLLGVLPGDEMIDLFPGSGGIGRATIAYASLAAARDGSSRSSTATRRASTRNPSRRSSATRRADPRVV